MAKVLTDEQKKNMAASMELRYILEDRGADARRPAMWLSKKLGICETTARKYIAAPGEMPVAYLWALKLRDDEIMRLL